ncbi:hypothetical protein ACFL0Q_03185 [Thermodesulfobacteriota bacterium]
MITNKEIQKLLYYSIDFAYLMEDDEIEKVILDFGEILNMRAKHRRGS